MIQVNKPRMNTEKILEGLREILNMGWIGLGPKTKELEQKIGSYLDAKHVTCLNSGTSALHLAVKSLGLKEGDMVATTPITFVATNHVLLYEKLTPVFYDVERTTGNVDVDSLARVLRNHSIKAIMVVHIGGYPCNIHEVNELAKMYNIPVIEDCAHAFGSRYANGKNVGDSPNLCCFSFHAVKNLTMGDGGAIITPIETEDKHFKKMRWMGIDLDTATRTHGMKSWKWEYNVEMLGYKYHSNDITAVIGLAQLETIDKDNERRREIANYYKENLNAIHPDYDDKRISSGHFYPVFFEDRAKVYAALVENEIFPGMHYKRNDLYDMYKDFPKDDLKGADWYEKHELTLPVHLGLSDDDLEKIVGVVNEV